MNDYERVLNRLEGTKGNKEKALDRVENSKKRFLLAKKENRKIERRLMIGFWAIAGIAFFWILLGLGFIGLIFYILVGIAQRI